MTIRYLLVISVLGVSAVSGGRLKADDEPSAETGEQTHIADVLMASVDIVFSKHVDPPTRGELLRRGVKGMFMRADVFQPDALGRRISELKPAEYTAFLRDMMQIARQAGVDDEELQAAFLNNLLDEQRAGTQFSELPLHVPAKEYLVQQQIRDNRYVGIGIQLGQVDGRPSIVKVLVGGPASKSGGRTGDIIFSIDGTDTEDMNLNKAIELLRGSDGEPLTLTVRQPNETEEKTLDLVRSEVPLETVVGRVRETDGWLFDVEPTQKIAYVKITAIRASTLGELRETARRLRSVNFGALVLDLRSTEDGDVRHTIMLADELLGEASLGAFTDTHGTHDVTSNAQSLLPELPLAVLIDTAMPNGARWIAATVQDNERGVLVGIGTPASEWSVSELTELVTGAGALLLPTAILHRPHPDSALTRRMFRWTPSVGFGGATFSKQDEDVTRFVSRPGARRWSLLPDHFVNAPRIPGNRRSFGSVGKSDSTVKVAIEVLHEQIELGRADAIAE